MWDRLFGVLAVVAAMMIVSATVGREGFPWPALVWASLAGAAALWVGLRSVKEGGNE